MLTKSGCGRTSVAGERGANDGLRGGSVSMKSFFDTNVLVYLFDLREPEKKMRAQEVFDVEVRAERAILSTQVLQEFYVNVTRKLSTPLPAEEAERRVRDFATLPLVQVDVAVILAAIARTKSMSVSF